MFVGYYDDLKAYKVWVPCTHSLIKSRDVIFNEKNHIEHITIMAQTMMIYQALGQTTFLFPMLLHHIHLLPQHGLMIHKSLSMILVTLLPPYPLKESPKKLKKEILKEWFKLKGRRQEMNWKLPRRYMHPKTLSMDHRWIYQMWSMAEADGIKPQQLKLLIDEEDKSEKIETALLVLAEDEPKNFNAAM